MRRGRPNIKVTRKQLDKAYRLYRKGKLYKEIIKKLDISQSFWQRNKNIFDDYFRQQIEKEEKEHSFKRGRGQPKGNRKFTLEKRKQLLECLEHDISLSDAARIVGVHKDTVYNWCKEYPSFKREIDTARDIGIKGIKKALSKSAKGGFIMEVVTKEFIDSKGKVLAKERTKKRKFIPANVNAQTFILVNRAGWSKDSESKGSDNKGDILKALENATDISEDKLKEFDK